MIDAPLDVVCQQLIAMACAGECAVDEAFALIRKAGADGRARPRRLRRLPRLPGRRPRRAAGGLRARARRRPALDLAADLEAQRLVRRPRAAASIRWFWSNVGTITSEESVRVLADGVAIGTLEGAYAERLVPGDRFVLDGRCLEFRRREGRLIHARAGGRRARACRSGRATASRSRPSWPARWPSSGPRERRRLARGRAARPPGLADRKSMDLEPRAAAVLAELIEAQERLSEVPRGDRAPGRESSRTDEEPGLTYAFHAPLNRAACEALGRATAARLGRRFGRDLALQAADLGWSIRLPEGARARLDRTDFDSLLALDVSSDDVLEGLDRGDLPAQRFRHVAATGLMVLRNPERAAGAGRRPELGEPRLYPLVKAACPDHPLLRETRREVLARPARRPRRGPAGSRSRPEL